MSSLLESVITQLQKEKILFRNLTRGNASLFFFFSFFL